MELIVYAQVHNSTRANVPAGKTGMSELNAHMLR